MTLLQFLKVIDWQELSLVIVYCEQNCFYDTHVSGVGHGDYDRHESQARSACTLRYDWFAGLSH